MVIKVRVDTREKIMQIATNLFAQRGFAGVSIRELTIAADVNISAISYHFHGKEGLYKEVIEEQLFPVIEAIDFAEKKEGLTPVEKLGLWSKLVIGVHTKHPLLIRFVSGELNNPTVHGSAIVQEYMSRVHDFLHQALAEGVQKGTFREDLNINHATISLISILNFYFYAKPLMGKVPSIIEADLGDCAKEVLDIYFKGIFKKND